MRVLYPLRYFPTLTETFIYNEIDRVQQLDPSVSVHIAALGTRDDGARPDRLPDAPVLRVPRRPLAGRLQRATAGMRWLAQHQRAKDAARLPWLARRIGGVDRLHVHFAGEAAEWAHALWLDCGVPYSVMVHAVDLFRPRPSLATVLQHADMVTTVADHHVRILGEMGIAAERVRCGPALDAFTATPVSGGPLRALFIGRAVPKKGLDTLLAAWHSAPEGATLEVISDHRGEVPPGVAVLGPQPHPRVRAAIQRAQVVVLPCRQAEDGDLDGVPVVLMEALAAGRPVLTTPVSGIPELVDEAVGWLVPPGDPQALAEALGAITADACQRRGARGRDRLRARGFTLTDQAHGMLTRWV